MERDVIIVGGGPGGLSTALHLHRIAPQLASRILILEKARYPRLKLCAGGLVPDAELILQRLGLNVGEIPHADADELHVDFEGRGLRIRIPERHALRVIRRDEFDAWLADKVRERGMEIREGITVRNVIPGGDGVTVETDHGAFHAEAVVGADGSNGVTRRCILPRAPVHTARVLEVITPVRAGEIATPPAARVARNDRNRERAAYFDFTPIPNNIAGYVWDFPTQVGGTSMRCWGIYDTNMLANEERPQLREPLAREMERFGLDLSDYEIKGFPIRWFSPQAPMSAPRVLLVGDAVGADPLFGEGISIALAYGAMAARTIADSFERNDFSFHAYRPRVLRSPLGQTLLLRWLTARIVYQFKWKWFQILTWRVLKPVARAAAWLYVLNWAKRMEFPAPAPERVTAR